MPTRAPVSFTRAMSASRFFGTVGSGWWLGKRPSMSQKSAIGVEAERAQRGDPERAAGAVARVDDDLEVAAPRESMPLLHERST